MAKHRKKEPPWGMLSFLVNVVRLLLSWLWPHH
jgi:hypothetical protein